MPAFTDGGGVDTAPHLPCFPVAQSRASQVIDSKFSACCNILIFVDKVVFDVILVIFLQLANEQPRSKLRGILKKCELMI